MRIAIALILSCVGFFSVSSARADNAQCAFVTASQATKIANILLASPDGAKFFQYSAYDQRFSPWQKVDKFATSNSGSGWRQIHLNGVAVAVGTVYYRAKDNRAYNLAMQVGCSVEGAPRFFDIPDPTPVPPAGSQRYMLSVQINVMSSDVYGRSWDWKDGLPDLVVHGGISLRGKTIAPLSCRNPNTLTATCLNGTVIDASEDMWLVLHVDDKGGEDESIGKLSVSLRDAVRYAGRSINVRTTGQIKSATLKLIPVE